MINCGHVTFCTMYIITMKLAPLPQAGVWCVHHISLGYGCVPAGVTRLWKTLSLKLQVEVRSRVIALPGACTCTSFHGRAPRFAIAGATHGIVGMPMA